MFLSCMTLHISVVTGHYLQNLAFKACVACSFQLCAFELHLFGNALVQCVLLNWLVKLIQVDNLHNFGSIDMLDKLEF